jgi:ribonuclease HI
MPSSQYWEAYRAAPTITDLEHEQHPLSTIYSHLRDSTTQRNAQLNLIKVKVKLLFNNIHQFGSRDDNRKTEKAFLENFIANSAKIPSAVPPHFKTHHFSMVMNAAPTQRRTRWFLSRTRPAPTTPCYLCKAGEDSMQHLFGNCTVVAEAIQATAHHAERDHSRLLSFPGILLFKPLEKKEVELAIHIAHAVWIVRKWTTLPARSIVQMTLVSLGCDRQARADSLQATIQRKARAALTRTSSVRETIRIINDIPDDAIITYTDGSAIGTGGPAGAGMYQDRPFYTITYAALGASSNNRSELTAIGMAITAGDRQTQIRKEHYIITDSDHSIGALTKDWTIKHNGQLIRTVKDLINNSLHNIHFIWVPGHADILGNEISDRAANMGSDDSGRGLGITPDRRLADFLRDTVQITGPRTKTIIASIKKDALKDKKNQPH